MLRKVFREENPACVQKGRGEVLLGGWRIGFPEGANPFRRAVLHKRAFGTELVSHRKVREKILRMARQKQKEKPALPSLCSFGILSGYGDSMVPL